MLYVVSTPIGNLQDITLRAIDLLNSVDLVFAEDTRRTGNLLKRHNIKNTLSSYNDKNKVNKTRKAIGLLKQGKEIAIVSDAGTPGISDPGFYLIREAIKNNIQISPVPGANAAISALVCSGLPTDKFGFYGFLPKKEKKKKEFFENLSKNTIVFYESPYRLIKTLKLMADIIPKRNMVIARELTKKFEEFIRGTVKEIYDRLKDKKIKGEIVVILDYS